MKPVGAAGEDAKVRVGRFGSCVGQSGVQHVVDARQELLDGAREFDEWGKARFFGPADPPEDESAPLSLLGRNGDPELFLQQVSGEQRLVHLGDGLDHRLLIGTLVEGGLEKGPAGTLHALGEFGVPRALQLSPHLTTHLVEGLGRPRHHVEGVETDLRPLRPLRNDSVDPLRSVARDVGEQGGSFLPEGVEELLQRRHVASFGGPDETTGVVVDDTGDVPLTLSHDMWVT